MGLVSCFTLNRRWDRGVKRGGTAERCRRARPRCGGSAVACSVVHPQASLHVRPQTELNAHSLGDAAASVETGPSDRAPRGLGRPPECEATASPARAEFAEPSTARTAQAGSPV